MPKEYNYETFTKSDYASGRFREDLRVGTRAPDFEADLLNGGKFTLSSRAGKSNVLLTFGSITCPPSIASAKTGPNSLEVLHREYRDKGFEFFFVYVREAHPGERIPGVASYEEKRRNAERLRREEELRIPIIVDGIDGPVHHAYGLQPNMLYVISRQGLIVYKSDWADTEELKQLFDNLLAWERARREAIPHKAAYSERLHYVPNDDIETRRRVYARSGEKAVRDYTEAMGRPPFAPEIDRADRVAIPSDRSHKTR